MLGIQDRRRVIICIFPSCQIHTHKRRLPQQRTERYLHTEHTQIVTELRRQFHLHNGYGICWPRSSSANHRQSHLLLACKCILLLMLLQIECASLSVTIRKHVLASSFSIQFQYLPPFYRLKQGVWYSLPFALQSINIQY